MEKIQACFVCTTPYQIITSINLVRKTGMAADLYVVPQFREAEDIAERIRAEKIFRKVIYIHSDEIEKHKKAKTSFLLHVGIALNYLRLESIVKKFHAGNTVYEEIYISSKANVGRLMRLYYTKKRIPLKIIHIEDGESSYDNALIIKPSRIDGAIQKALFGTKAVAYDYEMMLYCPELFRILNPESDVRVKKLPPIVQDSETIRLYNTIFGFSEKDAISEDVIVLDILRENLLSGEDETRRKVYQTVFDKYGKENVIIKRHPRDKSPEAEGLKYYKNYVVPFEVILLNMNLSNKTLITISSTAVTVPKILFDMEPEVYYIGNLVKTKQGKIANAIAYYSACREMYRDKNRFKIPGSMEELQ